MVPSDTGPHRDFRSTEASGDVFVTEVRVHGVGGATPDQILKRTDISPESSTDGVAGF